MSHALKEACLTHMTHYSPHISYIQEMFVKLYFEISKQENRFSEKKVHNTKFRSVAYMTTSVASEEFSRSNSLSLSCRFVFCCIAASSTLVTHNSGENTSFRLQFLEKNLCPAQTTTQ